MLNFCGWHIWNLCPVPSVLIWNIYSNLSVSDNIRISGISVKEFIHNIWYMRGYFLRYHKSDIRYIFIPFTPSDFSEKEEFPRYFLDDKSFCKFTEVVLDFTILFFFHSLFPATKFILCSNFLVLLSLSPSLCFVSSSSSLYEATVSTEWELWGQKSAVSHSFPCISLFRFKKKKENFAFLFYLSLFKFKKRNITFLLFFLSHFGLYKH